jgi:DNA-binding NarL/FixJ family response regulator
MVDDHEGFRKAMRLLLESNSSVAICGEAINGVEAVEKARQLQPDVILMDITMDGLDGLDATRQIRSEIPFPRVVIVSQHDSPHMISTAMKAGASAYVTKSHVVPDLFDAIEAVMKRQTSDPPATRTDAAAPKSKLDAGKKT